MDGLAGAAHPGQGVGDLPLQQQSAVEDDIGRRQLRHVGSGQLIGVRVHPFTHQTRDRGAVSGDRADEIRHLRRGRDDTERRFGGTSRG
jgi:hypothetical protein